MEKNIPGEFKIQGAAACSLFVSLLSMQPDYDKDKLDKMDKMLNSSDQENIAIVEALLNKEFSDILILNNNLKDSKQ